ncbi:MAG: ABC transporter ATP-binding protein [Planctomycetes bacterium]|nr:ABC transporter ATP-binding protein [Planctomycetota bacterium]
MSDAQGKGILQVKDVSLELGGKLILDRLNIDFWSGHIHAVVGQNGAGKSTLANTIMGLSGYRHHSGDIIFEGETIKGLSVDQRARRGITLAWQEPARFEGLKVSALLFAAMRGKDRDRAAGALEQVGLEPAAYLDRAADKTLSGGERKRIELASILAMRPKVVLLDEPDSGIDVDALEHIFSAMRSLKGQGTTVIVITHSPTVLKQSEHAFLICCGKLIYKGGTAEISRYFENTCGPCDHKGAPTLKELT